MKAKIALLAGACALVIASCNGLGAAGPAAKSALELVAPLAADALSELIRSRYGTEADKESAGCYALPEFVTDEDGFEYVICRAKPAE